MALLGRCESQQAEDRANFPSYGQQSMPTFFSGLRLNSGVIGCAEYVEQPEDIRPALERALAAGHSALVNVVTDPLARAVSVHASAYREV